MRFSKLSRFGFGLLLLCTQLPEALAQRGMDEININGQFVLAARAGRVERVAALLGQGAAVNSRDRNGDSPLNMAAIRPLKSDSSANWASNLRVRSVMRFLE